MTPSPIIRRQLRDGDPEAIVAHHGELYSREYGVDRSFRDDVGASVASALERGWPGPGEGIWIVEADGEHAGSLALTDEDHGAAALRWVVLDPGLRGRGLGRRMVAEAVAEAEATGYATLGLMTFSELTTAARIYRSHGFELRSAETGPRWGREELTYQRYELSFQARAQERSSPSAGSSSRPFSVNA
jgi:GNAT superfamily N-acetyltransferase